MLVSVQATKFAENKEPSWSAADKNWWTKIDKDVSEYFFVPLSIFVSLLLAPVSFQFPSGPYF